MFIFTSSGSTDMDDVRNMLGPTVIVLLAFGMYPVLVDAAAHTYSTAKTETEEDI